MKRAVWILLSLATACTVPPPPVEPPRQTLAIDVVDAQGEPIVAAVRMHLSADLDTWSTRPTDGSGHLEWNLPAGPRDFVVFANGYLEEHLEDFDNSCFGMPPCSMPRHTSVTLKPKPVVNPRPTRAQVLAIRANFFGARDVHGRIIFDPVLAVLPQNEREEWYAQKKAEKLTHIVVAPAFAYPGFPSFDWWSEPARFGALLEDVLAHGFIPVVQLASGEHFLERNARFASNPELTRHLVADFRTLVPALAAWHRFAIWSTCWECIGPPEWWWTARQLVTAIETLDSLLPPEAVIAVHAQPNRVTGASYCGHGAIGSDFGACVAVSQDPDGGWNFVEPDDPSRGDEIGFFSLPAGRRIDLWLFQMDHDRHMADPGLPPCASAFGRVCETLRRWIPESQQAQALQTNSERGPQWFRDKRPIFCAFETGALNVKNGDFGPEGLTLVANRLAALGVTCFGNGVPR